MIDHEAFLPDYTMVAVFHSELTPIIELVLNFTILVHEIGKNIRKIKEVSHYGYIQKIR